jgi:hypothetical protein
MALEQFNQAAEGPPIATALKAGIEKWQVEIARLERVMADHQLKFRSNPEPQQAEKLMTELLEMTADLMAAREAITRLKGELSALRALRSSYPWWWRMMIG